MVGLLRSRIPPLGRGATAMAISVGLRSDRQLPLGARRGRRSRRKWARTSSSAARWGPYAGRSVRSSPPTDNGTEHPEHKRACVTWRNRGGRLCERKFLRAAKTEWFGEASIVTNRELRPR